MKLRRLVWTALVGLAALTVGRKAAADEPPERYYYFGYDYGSQALYNPLYVLVNRGFDVLQVRPGQRGVFEYEYGEGAENVAKNLANPVPNVSKEGWGQFLREEIFPLSYTPTTARWVPNYSLHLIGGGMTYVALREWYEAHDVPAPGLASAATNLAAAFINETLENKGIVGPNTDCIADVYFFDIGGMLLFSIDGVDRFFSRELIIADWSLQPSLTAPHADLHNIGQYFSAKWPLPFYQRLRLFSYFGMSTLFGLSYQLDNELSVSGAVGMKGTRLVSLSTTTARTAVDWAPTAAVFVDRNNSLLASLQVANVEDYFISFNLYPRAVKMTDPAIGFWSAIGKHGETILGISSTYSFGMGVGYDVH